VQTSPTFIYVPATDIFNVYVWPVTVLCMEHQLSGSAVALTCATLLSQFVAMQVCEKGTVISARYRIRPDNVQAIDLPSSLTETEISCRCSQKFELYDMTNVQQLRFCGP
jgi:hypothetical protein